MSYNGKSEQKMKKQTEYLLKGNIELKNFTNVFYIYVDEEKEDFKDLISKFAVDGFELACLFCVENFENFDGFTLLYVLETKQNSEFTVLCRKIQPENINKVTSVNEIFPSSSLYEREIMDGFGIKFIGGFNEQRLFLHEIYPKDFHPLLKAFKNTKIETNKNIEILDEYKFKNVFGEGVYHIPVGPVHAGIIEPGHFRFSVIGERIMNLETRMFYKHRGVEKISEGKTPDECVKIAESISGDESVANAVAFCMAVEKISEISIPDRAEYLRGILLEMERIYSHTGDLAGMITDVGFPVGASKFLILREEILRKNEKITGSRFMKEIIDIGGLKKDISDSALSELFKFFDDKINGWKKRFDEAVKSIYSTASVIDRFETTGVVKPEIVEPLHLTGPIARASGIYADTRLSHPYGIYKKIRPKIITEKKGDVMARFNVKAKEITESINIIQQLITFLLENITNETKEKNHIIKDGYAFSVVEAPRGESFHFVYIKNGVVERYKIRTPSFCNWQAIEHAVIGEIIPDFPLINKSMNLSYAGNDL